MTTTGSLRNRGILALGLALVAGGGAFWMMDGGSEAAAETAPAVLAGNQAELPSPDPSLPAVKVWKSPTCGCCSLWVEHMRRAGFEVEVEDLADLTHIKHEHGVGAPLQSCHTALVDGYVIEGHVPADDVKRLLTERPQVLGLAAPGMPVGSPGMEMGGRKDAYDVLTFDGAGKTTVWSRH